MVEDPRGPDFMKKVLFLVNRISGKQGGMKLEETIGCHLQGMLTPLQYDLTFTERDSVKQVKSVAPYYETIAVVGGDGTLHHVVRGIVDMECKPKVGIVPAGTGNDFIQILGFPDKFEAMNWEVFFSRQVINMDAGICNGTHFINGMGLGFDAQVAAENYTEPGEVKKGGKNKYIWHIVKTLLLFREKNAVINTGGERQEKSCFINTIANGRRFAGGFFLTPNAVANDGLLDVCNIEKLNLLKRFKLLPSVPKGTHLADSKVNYYQTDRISIQFDCDVPFHLDGELHFSSRFDVHIIPSALQVIFNPEGNHYFSL